MASASARQHQLWIWGFWQNAIFWGIVFHYLILSTAIWKNFKFNDVFLNFLKLLIGSRFIRLCWRFLLLLSWIGIWTTEISCLLLLWLNFGILVSRLVAEGSILTIIWADLHHWLWLQDRGGRQEISLFYAQDFNVILYFVFYLAGVVAFGPHVERLYLIIIIFCFLLVILWQLESDLIAILIIDFGWFHHILLLPFRYHVFVIFR